MNSNFDFELGRKAGIDEAVAFYLAHVPCAGKLIPRRSTPNIKKKTLAKGMLAFMVDNNSIIVGTCGICSGPVTVPRIYHSTQRPVPTCEHCGATTKPDYGKILPMTPQTPPKR